MRRMRQLILALVLVASLFAACASSEPTPLAAEYDAEVAIAWFELQLELAQATPGFSPPVASRAFGYAGVALYESIVPGMPEYQSLAGQLNGLGALPRPDPDDSYHWPAVANSALAMITRRLFANATADWQASIDALEKQFGDELATTLDAAVVERSIAHGRAVADAIYAWSVTDGGSDGYATNFPVGYVPPTGPGMWEPTPPLYQSALQPYWGTHRPFVMPSAGECAPPPPPDYSEQPGSPFYQEALEVYEAVRQSTPEQAIIASFWADNPGSTPTPPGHSIAILNQVLATQHASLALAAEAYAKVGMAVADAFIACWHTKYEYNLIRPITYIQRVIDPDWSTPVSTPPFPEYTSGHSVQSGAAAQVLTDLFGENFAFVDHTHDERGFAPRAFESFFDFADEAAISRLYGGIHYRSAIENGIDQGKCIGRRVSDIRFEK